MGAGPITNIDRMDRADLSELQSRALTQLMDGLSQRSPFYAVKFKDVAVSPSALGSLPLTARGELVEAQMDSPPMGGLLTRSLQDCSLIGFTNAIATGIAGYPELAIAVTSGDMRERVAIASRVFSGGGVEPDDRTAIAGEVARSVLHHSFLGGMVAVGATPFQIGRGLTLRHVRHTLPVLRPTQLVTHPSYAMFLARLIGEEGIDLPVRRLFLWGEVGPSVPSVRKTLEVAWGGADIIDVFAMEELGILGSGCKDGTALHGFEDAFVYEVIDPDSGETLRAGQPGELVVTSLRTDAMPLVKYRTGDLVELLRDGCSCERTHVRFRVLGRVVQGREGMHSIDLASLEDEVGGPYRVVVGSGDPKLEIGDIPEAPHRRMRIACEEDLDLWEAIAREQRRLEL